MSYAPEHHPSCPAFVSFDLGESLEESPQCLCIECKRCRGSGMVHLFSMFTDMCPNCEGNGTVLVKDVKLEDI